jgi:hypothetical protein
MHKLFTTNDLIRFAYNEMPYDEAIELAFELKECEELSDELGQISETCSLLNQTALAVPSGRVKALLNYSKSLNVCKLPHTNFPIEVVLN